MLLICYCLLLRRALPAAAGPRFETHALTVCYCLLRSVTVCYGLCGQHPARDEHDTFFVKTPAATLDIPREYLERVRATHEDGGASLGAEYASDSTGWRYEWSEEVARTNLLRTHTTAVSSRTLHALAQAAKVSGEGLQPQKYFSIDRCGTEKLQKGKFRRRSTSRSTGAEQRSRKRGSSAAEVLLDRQVWNRAPAPSLPHACIPIPLCICMHTYTIVYLRRRVFRNEALDTTLTYG